MLRPARTISAVLAVAAATRTAASAQTTEVSGYVQNVFLANQASPLLDSGLSDAARLRFDATIRGGAWSLEIAPEQFVRWSSSTRAGSFAGLPAVRSAGDWLPLDGTLTSGDRASWRHRIDRLLVSYSAGPVTVTVGRQAISWATTLFLSPADPFAPFEPSDPFREFRTGVDAVRIQWYPGPLAELELVGRLTDETHTLLGRARASVGGWDLSAWGGALHDQPAAAIGVAKTLGGSALRTEAELRRTAEGTTAFRGTVGFDRRVTLLGRDLYLVGEYQHDQLGAAAPDQFAVVAASAPALLGELQVLGRDEALTELTWQAHPLISLETLGLWNLNDGSLLLAPAVSVSVTQASSLRIGGVLGFGRAPDTALMRSEYGGLPGLGYAALSLYF